MDPRLIVAGVMVSWALCALWILTGWRGRKREPDGEDASLPNFPRFEPKVSEARHVHPPIEAPAANEERFQPAVEQLSERPIPAPPRRNPLPSRDRFGRAEPEEDLPPPQTRLWMEVLRNVGCVVFCLPFVGVVAGLGLLRLDPLLGLAVAAGAVLVYLGFTHVVLYITVREGAQGLPLPQRINTPLHAEEDGIPTGSLAEAQFGPEGLLAIGFEPAGWFYIDRFSGYRVGAWRYPGRPDVAYVILQPGGAPRIRFIRRFADGVLLVTTNKKTDLGSTPSPSYYVQMRDTPTAAELWSWHREAQALFPQDAAWPEQPITEAGTVPSVPPELIREAGLGPMELYIEHGRRTCEAALRGRWWWLPGSGLVGELVRLGRLPGLSVKKQIESGWAVPVARRVGVAVGG